MEAVNEIAPGFDEEAKKPQKQDASDAPDSSETKLIEQAKKDFQRIQDFEGKARKNWNEDIKFANADSENGYQWPNKIRINRDLDDRPCLTINKVRQHCLQIINDAKQNKPSIKIRPTGGKATYESAQAFEGVVRYIEYISNAQTAYDTATVFQVQGGIGYWRIVTDYAGDDTFDQEVFIRRVKDPLTVYLDPDAQEADKSDGKIAFVFDDMLKDDFKAAYPDWVDLVGNAALGNGDGWIDDKHIRVAEYFKVIKKKDKLYALEDHKGGTHIVRESKIPEDLKSFIIDVPANRIRAIEDNVVEWYLIAGNRVIEKREWPGRYIPIVPLIGEEVVIEGELDRKGHVRNMKDPQRMYNYWSSSAVEFVALQGKSPWVAPARAIEGLETYWGNANRTNHAVLPWNDIDDEGKPVAAPFKPQAPQMAPAYIEGMKVSAGEMEFVTGQYAPQMGEPSNERSGKAINARQRQGDRSTYHFVDNLGVAIGYTGRILIDLIPKIYDTKRVIKMLAEDGTQDEITVDPHSPEALQMAQKQKRKVMSIFNPSVGKYGVEADIGPAYATKREEAFNAFTQLLGQSPQLVGTIGDLMFRFADFPGADKIAERLERLVPPNIKGDGPTPQMQKAAQLIQHLGGLLKTAQNQLTEEKSKSKSFAEKRDIDAYKAFTDRMEVLFKEHQVTPKDLSRMLHELMQQEHSVSLQPPVNAANETLMNEGNSSSAAQPTDLSQGASPNA